MNESRAQDLVDGAALVVAAIYFYRKLIEPATGENAAASSAGIGATPDAGNEPESILANFRGPARNLTSRGEPATVGGAAAQLFGKGKPPSTERFVVGWGFVFLTLSLAVPIAPELAGAFAALVALGSILGNGAQVGADLETQLHHESSPQTQTSADVTPTTMVTFAGQSAAAIPAAFPEGEGKRSSKKKPGKRSKFRVQSA